MSRITREERGQGLVEYALIIVLVSIAAVLALGFLSGKINNLFSKSGNVLNNLSLVSGAGAPPAPPPPTETLLTDANTTSLINADFSVFYLANQVQWCSTNNGFCLIGIGTWQTIAQPGTYSFIFPRSGACSFTFNNGYTFAGSWDFHPGAGYYRRVGDTIPIYRDACL